MSDVVEKMSSRNACNLHALLARLEENAVQNQRELQIHSGIHEAEAQYAVYIQELSLSTPKGHLASELLDKKFACRLPKVFASTASSLTCHANSIKGPDIWK